MLFFRIFPAGIEPGVFYVPLHWQSGSLPLAPPRKPLVFFIKMLIEKESFLLIEIMPLNFPNDVKAIMMDMFSFIRLEGIDGIEPSGSDLVAHWNHFESLKIPMLVQQGFRM